VDDPEKTEKGRVAEVRTRRSRKAKLERVSPNITECKKAMEKLEASEKKFKDLAEITTDWIWEVDKNGVYTYTSPKIRDLLGYETDEIIGKTPFDFMPEEEAEKTGKFFREKVTKEEPFYGLENVNCHKDGHLVILETNGIPLFDKRGRLEGYRGIDRDITERKKAEEVLRESEEKFRTFMETASDLMYIIDKVGNLAYVNNAIVRTLGYSKDEIIGMHLAKVLGQKEAKKYFERKLQELITRGEIDVESVWLTKDGKEIYGQTKVVAVYDKDGNFEEGRGILHDITERKRAEEKLLDYQMQLKALASQLTLAEEHERYRLATELHDRIAQSLVVSKLRLETVRDSDSSADLAKVLNETARSIEQIIQDVRLLTFELSSPILNELGFEDAVAEWLTEQIDKKHDIATEFEDDGQPKPLDDDTLAVLFRDVRELLVNAVKHAYATKIKVSVCRVDKHICVSVEDNGAGFNPAEIVTMAVRTGRFGLFSIRERLEELGGHLEIKSTPGYGTRITVTAPLKQEK